MKVGPPRRCARHVTSTSRLAMRPVALSEVAERRAVPPTLARWPSRLRTARKDIAKLLLPSAFVRRAGSFEDAESSKTATVRAVFYLRHADKRLNAAYRHFVAFTATPPGSASRDSHRYQRRPSDQAATFTTAATSIGEPASVGRQNRDVVAPITLASVSLDHRAAEAASPFVPGRHAGLPPSVPTPEPAC